MLVERGVKSNIPFNALHFILPSDRDLSAHCDLLCSYYFLCSTMKSYLGLCLIGGVVTAAASSDSASYTSRSSKRGLHLKCRAVKDKTPALHRASIIPAFHSSCTPKGECLVFPSTTKGTTLMHRVRGGGPGIFRREDYFEETAVDRGRCLARMYTLTTLLYAVVAGVLSVPLPKYMPAVLAPFLLDSGDPVLARSFGVGAVAVLLLSVVVVKNRTARVSFPLNATLLLSATGLKALLLAVLSYRFFPPSSTSPYASFPRLFAFQTTVTQFAQALFAAYLPARAESLFPYLLTTVLTLVPARPLSLLLSLPLPSVMVAAALSFLASVIILLASQSSVQGGAHRNGWEAVAEMVTTVLGGVGQG